MNLTPAIAAGVLAACIACALPISHRQSLDTIVLRSLPEPYAVANLLTERSAIVRQPVQNLNQNSGQIPPLTTSRATTSAAEGGAIERRGFFSGFHLDNILDFSKMNPFGKSKKKKIQIETQAALDVKESSKHMTSRLFEGESSGPGLRRSRTATNESRRVLEQFQNLSPGSIGRGVATLGRSKTTKATTFVAPYKTESAALYRITKEDGKEKVYAHSYYDTYTEALHPDRTVADEKELAGKALAEKELAALGDLVRSKHATPAASP